MQLNIKSPPPPPQLKLHSYPTGSVFWMTLSYTKTSKQLFHLEEE